MMMYSQAPLPTTLTEETLIHALQVLAHRDTDLAAILRDFGPPPLWARDPGFGTLVYIILEQQVSITSAKAAYMRLLSAISPLTPERFLELDDLTLKTIGFSRQKIGYSRHLANAIIEGRLHLAAFDEMSDDAVRSELIALKGIGPWTADIYLLQALRRPDIWPSGDLALGVAVQQIKRLPTRPTPAELDAMSVLWQPWRAVAARLFWHYYLSRRTKFD